MHLKRFSINIYVYTDMISSIYVYYVALSLDDGYIGRCCVSFEIENLDSILHSIMHALYETHYSYVQIYTYIYTYMHVCMHACINAYSNSHKYVLVYTRYTCVNSHHPYTYIDTYMYINIYVRVRYIHT